MDSNNIKIEDGIPADTKQYVIFSLHNSYYGVWIMQVQEIIKMTEITELPNSPQYIDGIVNLRGKIIPVINLFKKLHINGVHDENYKILVLNVDGFHFGVVVDKISDVELIAGDTIEPPPKISNGINGKYIKGIAKTEKRLIILLDIEKIVTEEEIKESIA